MPKRVRHRKTQRGTMRGNATRGNTVEFGEYGLQSLETGWVDNHHLEAGRVAISHHVGSEGRTYIRVFPHKSVSAKPLESRMGKGKGEPDRWVAVVKPGTIIYEVAGVDEDRARGALYRAAHKMPVRCRLVHRRPRL